jgi:hypothetical protein
MIIHGIDNSGKGRKTRGSGATTLLAGGGSRHKPKGDPGGR